jgi:hypothetical protein
MGDHCSLLLVNGSELEVEGSLDEVQAMIERGPDWILFAATAGGEVSVRSSHVVTVSGLSRNPPYFAAESHAFLRS